MARLCERPGCSAPASVAYGFEADRFLVFLQPFEPELADGIRSGVLCRRHADALTPPRGWWLDDRRDERPRLFVPRTPAPDPSHGSQRTRTARTRRPKLDPAEPSPTLFDESDAADLPEPGETEEQPAAVEPNEPAAATAEPDEPAAAQAEPDEPAAAPVEPERPELDLDETRALPWVPAFDRSDDLGGALRARSPLLSRAFGNRPDKPL
jgi:hypothetical protein